MNLSGEKNLGNTDRIIRTSASTLLLGAVATGLITGRRGAAVKLFAVSQLVEASFAY